MPTHVTHGQIVSAFPGQGQGQGHGTPPPFAQLPIVGVTADSSLTADSACWTADGRIICTPASVVEAASAFDDFDALAVAGGAVIDADLAEAAAASDLADAVSDVAADAVEAATASDETDAAVGAQVLFGTVDEPASALDQLNATVVPLSAIGGGGGRYYPPLQLRTVEGIGYGVLPPLRGKAHGTVGASVVFTLQIRGEAHGVVDEFPNDLELMLMMLAA